MKTQIKKYVKLFVEAGAAFLDEKAPGWVMKVNTDTLRMENPLACILAQVFDSDYHSTADVLGLPRTYYSRMGFSCNEDHYKHALGIADRNEQTDIFENYVQAAWVTLILKRKQEPKYIKQQWIDRYGAEVVDYAEGMYETDFDKEFYRDLDASDQVNYLEWAKASIEKREESD